MKKLLVACALLMGMTTAQAQEFHLGASVGVGVTGITVDAAATITDYVGIRAGADIFPSLVKLVVRKTGMPFPVSSSAPHSPESAFPVISSSLAIVCVPLSVATKNRRRLSAVPGTRYFLAR